MKKLEVASAAKRDLEQLSDYALDHFDLARADRVIDEITDRFRWLAETDFTGTPRDELQPGLRSYNQKAWRIFYRSDAEALRISRVLHQSRDIKADDFD